MPAFLSDDFVVDHPGARAVGTATGRTAQLRVLVTVLFIPILVASCSSSDEAPQAVAVSEGPAPDTMCPVGESPVAAAYERSSGAFKWAACSPGPALYLPRAATD